MLRERLEGLLLLLAGCGSLALIAWLQQSGWLQPARPPLPPGLAGQPLPILNPIACLLPLGVIGALGLCLVGLKRLFDPDNWRPPRHGG